jgi:hypothetical protein
VRALKVVAVAAGAVVVLGGCKPTAQAHRAETSSVATAPSTPPAASPLPVAPNTNSSTPIATELQPSTVNLTPTASATVSASTGGLSIVAVEIRALAALPIKGRAPMTGYSRTQFGPAWPTENGCDARNDVLRRDLTKATLRGSCTVETGTLISPYTGGAISFVRGPNSALVQIDHVVALGDAWQTGAQAWTAAKRETFANDLVELLAVDEHSNEQKGDADAASWLPSNKTFRCQYVDIQVEVKAKYGLWVTQAEHDAIAHMLANCGISTPTPTAVTPTPPPPKPAPTTTPPVVAPPKPIPTPTVAGPKVVHPGAFCTPAGATGVTSTGKPEVCKTTATDSRLRWRAA